MKYEIDATNESLGRLATKVTTILRGKNLSSFEPNMIPDTQVLMLNLEKAKFTGSKLKDKVYYHYTGYHSGLRTRKLSELWSSRPQYVFRQMVYRMLPKNKMRDKIIKNLKFK
jgi:large subunit ribosomal protein L13